VLNPNKEYNEVTTVVKRYFNANLFSLGRNNTAEFRLFKSWLWLSIGSRHARSNTHEWYNS